MFNVPLVTSEKTFVCVKSKAQKVRPTSLLDHFLHISNYTILAQLIVKAIKTKLLPGMN